MVDYTNYFTFVSEFYRSSDIRESLDNRERFLSLFYQYYIPGQRYLFSTKLFNEKYFYVDLGNETGREIFKYSVYDVETTSFVQQYLRPGDVFIDCGAAEAYFSFLAALQVGPFGEVHAFEINEDIAEVARMNCSGQAQIQFNLLGVADKAGRVAFNYYGREYSPYSTLMDQSRILGVNKQPIIQYCELIRFKDFLAKFFHEDYLGKNILIKLDIEGVEFDLLTDALPDIVKLGAVLIVEIGVIKKATQALLALFHQYQMNLYETGLGCPTLINQAKHSDGVDAFDYLTPRNILVSSSELFSQ
jgi:FkbM family methyltransferase